MSLSFSLRNEVKREIIMVKRNPPKVDQLRSKAKHCACRKYNNTTLRDECVKPMVRWDLCYKVKMRKLTVTLNSGDKEVWYDYDYWTFECYKILMDKIEHRAEEAREHEKLEYLKPKIKSEPKRSGKRTLVERYGLSEQQVISRNSYQTKISMYKRRLREYESRNSNKLIVIRAIANCTMKIEQYENVLTKMIEWAPKNE